MLYRQHIQKDPSGINKNRNFCYFLGFGILKSWNLLNTLFFPLEKKLGHGRKADEVREGKSKCIRNEVKS